MQTLLVSTRNPHKLKELADLLGIPGLRLVSAHAIALPEVEETGASFADNARLKAMAAYRAGGGEVWGLGDDSGLEVAALAGAPGVESARYAGPGATDELNNRLLLHNLRGVPEGGRGAAFVCHLALCAGGDLVTAEARVEGRILDSPRPGGGFGYDPLFFHPPSGCTYAELDPTQKNRVSHRARACQVMRAALAAILARR